MRPNGRRPIELKGPETPTASAYPRVTVTPNRVERTVLTNLLPGGLTVRHQIDSLQTALDTQRSEGWISEFILAAGQHTGRKLDEINLASLGSVVIVSGYAEDGCDAKTWGVALQIQKDVWHIENTARHAVVDLEHLALRALVADAPVAFQLAEELLNILEGVVRTSCAAETVNSILRPYLTVKRSFHSRETAQAWLNLFCLWFNMHLLNRSKRRQGDQPMSPYQYAGVKVYTDDGRETLDWLEALGYPADH